MKKLSEKYLSFTVENWILNDEDDNNIRFFNSVGETINSIWLFYDDSYCFAGIVNSFEEYEEILEKYGADCKIYIVRKDHMSKFMEFSSKEKILQALEKLEPLKIMNKLTGEIKYICGSE